jgi:glycosyltransferase involved in cell wall biosynthesis
VSDNIAINYYGHVGSPTGYGRAANDLCLALLRAGVRLQIFALGHDRKPAAGPEALAGIYEPLRASLPGESRGENHHPDIVLVHTLPMDCERLRAHIEPRYISFGANPRWVAYTTWEALTVPTEVTHALAGFDQVWVPSEWNRRVFGPLRKSFVVPHGIAEEEIPRRRELGAGESDPDGRYRFYWSGAFTARKNPAGLLRAFVHAFDRRDNVSLTIHSSGLQPSVVAEVLGRCGIAGDELPRLKFNRNHVTDDAMWTLPAAHDCYVSATNGEAWNFSAFDATLAGRKVIVPDAQGSDDFLVGKDSTKDVIVRSHHAPAQVDAIVQGVAPDGTANLVTVGAQGLTAKCMWAETDLWDLAAAMQTAAARGDRDAPLDYDLAERFGLTTIGRLALEHLERIP